MNISRKLSTHRSGFTLAELLIVMAILAILLALTFGGVSAALKSGYAKKTEAQIGSIKAALEQFHAEHGAYPESTDAEEGSKILYAALSGDTNYDGEISDSDKELDWFGNGASDRQAKSYLEELVGGGGQGWTEQDGGSIYIIDAFGNRIQYLADESPNAMYNAPNLYDIWSFGTDDQTDAEVQENKWIKNWQD